MNDAIQTVAENLTDDSPDWLKRASLSVEKSEDAGSGSHPLGGFVVTGMRRLHQFDPTYLDDSEPAESFRGREVKLVDHSEGVASQAKRFAAGCGLDASLYYQAGLWHDLGKLDPRFQAMLKQSSPRTAVGVPLAKSARSPRTKQERDEREVHRYPLHARHELLSAALVSTKTDDDLLLHLLSTHHGSGRPLAYHVVDKDSAKESFKIELFGQIFELPTSAQQIAALERRTAGTLLASGPEIRVVGGGVSRSDLPPRRPRPKPGGTRKRGQSGSENDGREAAALPRFTGTASHTPSAAHRTRRRKPAGLFGRPRHARRLRSNCSIRRLP